jgi:RTA1 like protein
VSPSAQEAICGPLANNEISFMTLEGAVIVTASLCLTIIHPGVCFMGAWSEAHFMLCFKISVEEKAVSISFDGETAASVQGILI